MDFHDRRDGSVIDATDRFAARRQDFPEGHADHDASCPTCGPHHAELDRQRRLRDPSDPRPWYNRLELDPFRGRQRLQPRQ